MKYFISILLLCFACSNSVKESANKTESSNPIIVKDYQLYKANSQEGLLILFPCFPCDANHTKANFDIIETANKRGVSVLLLNFNLHLYLNDLHKEILVDLLTQIVLEHELKIDNTYIGGFSSGGNIAFLLGNYLLKMMHSIRPKGVFTVDAPIDLLGLYKTSQRNIKKMSSMGSVQEGKRIVQYFETAFDKVDITESDFADYSPYLSNTSSVENIKYLKNIRLRLYTEPDKDWWKENRNASFEDTNSFYFEKLAKDLNDQSWENFEYISTTNKGYRANGQRHPHSWSIVEPENLLNWVLLE